MRSVVVLAVAAVVGALVPPTVLAKKRPKPPAACPGGRFPVSGGPLVPGGGAADAIVVDGTQVAVESGCPTVKAKRKRTRKRTILTARWSACGSLGGRTHLVVQLDAATCEALTGRFRNRRARIDRKIAGQVEVPLDAAGRVKDGLPEGAVLVTREEWDQITKRPDVHGYGAGRAAQDAAAAAAREAGDEQLVREFLDANPSFAAQYLGGVDFSDGSVVPADNGNYDVTFTDESKASRTVRTHGRRFFRGNVAEALRRFPTRENQLNLYTDYYDGLAAIDPALVGNYESPAKAANLPLDALRALNDTLAIQAGQFLPLVPPPGGFPPPGYPANCAAEEGSGDGTDRSGEISCGTHKALGVYANKSWPLKFFATCVKDQAARGTCWSFGTTGAIELTVAKKYARWINLTEQDLIYRYHWLWYPSLYGDGGWPPAALGRILETGHLYPFESQYDYNPSRSRTGNNMTRTYTNSCVGYGGGEGAYCSNTVGQGQIVCINLLLFYICVGVPPSYSTNSGVTVAHYSELWNSANTSNSLANIFWAVGIFRKPVIYSFAVAPSFFPDANGYVRYNGPHCPVTTDSQGMAVCTTTSGCECDIGGHAVLITGLVDNSQLPPGAPPGSGGGYVIIKNSWGHCYGDAGYAYLPYDWVKAYGWSAVVLGDVN